MKHIQIKMKTSQNFKNAGSHTQGERLHNCMFKCHRRHKLKRCTKNKD